MNSRLNFSVKDRFLNRPRYKRVRERAVRIGKSWYGLSWVAVQNYPNKLFESSQLSQKR